MSGSEGEDLRSEIRELREEVRALRLKCERQEDQVLALRALLHSLSRRLPSDAAERSPSRVAHRSCASVPASVSFSAASVPTGSGYSVVTGTEGQTNSETPSWEFHEEVARGIGGYFVRALTGVHRGSSGRDRLPQLKSRYYLIARDYLGNVYRSPLKVTTKFAEVKALCARGGDFGDSVFCGVPSIREGKVVASSAGLTWPDISP